MTTAKDDAALKALNVASVYVKTMTNRRDDFIGAHIKAEANARDMIEAAGLSKEVSRAVWNHIDRIALLARESLNAMALKRAALIPRVLRLLAKAFVVCLYLLVGVVSYWNVALIALCLVVSIVEHILLGDAFALKTIARTAKAVARFGSRF